MKPILKLDLLAPWPMNIYGLLWWDSLNKSLWHVGLTFTSFSVMLELSRSWLTSMNIWFVMDIHMGWSKPSKLSLRWSFSCLMLGIKTINVHYKYIIYWVSILKCQSWSYLSNRMLWNAWVCLPVPCSSPNKDMPYLIMANIWHH